jgi:hypothetical protein
MRRQYADDYRGWPVAPKTKQHPVRGSFLDPRTGFNYHHGIDISVRDDRPEPGAPAGRTHRVFALEGGTVWNVKRNLGPWKEGIVWCGHFGYGHIEPVVALGDSIRPGQLLGWTTEKEWHVHLSEWIFPGGDREKRVPVNPLDRDGKIAPFADIAPPVIHDVGFWTPASPRWRVGNGRAVFSRGGTRLDPSRLTGVVDVRARIEDPQSFRGWLRDVPALVTAHHPAKVRLAVTRLDDGRVIVERDVFSSEVTLGDESRRLGRTPVPSSHHYAPGTRQNLRGNTAVQPGAPAPQGELWFRLFARPRSLYWDTTRVRNGPYRLRVTAWDLDGNSTEATVDVAVANP